MRSKQSQKAAIDISKLPRHVAIVMDGNGRWAERRGFPRNVGHRRGLDVARKIIEEASQIGLLYLTLYMFSTENWKRPKAEVDFLMSLPGEFWKSEKETLARHNIRLCVLGDMSPIPPATKEVLEEAISVTSGRTGMCINLAINYGGRDDILQATKRMSILKHCIDGFSVDDFEKLLYTGDIPEVDLFIRPGGEVRLSNFLLWQIAYAELVFSETLWPDYGIDEFRSAISEFQSRKRRRGGLSSS